MHQLKCDDDLPVQGGDDSGMSLVELIVAMGVFSVFLAIFGSGIVIMTQDTVRTNATIDATNQGRRAFSQLDKQVRSASTINNPVLVLGTRWTVEFRTDATGASTSGIENPSLCTQWRVDTATDLLQWRSWNVGASTAPAWRTTATNVINTPSQQPFTFSPTSASSTKQKLAVDWFIKKSTAPTTAIDSVLVARNSNAQTSTNTSGTRVCTEMDASR